MSTNFFNRTQDKVANRETGYINRVYIAPRTAFTTIAEPTAPFTNPGDRFTITEDHTFATGKGFFELYCTQDTVDAPGEAAGDTGSKKMSWKPACFLPGDGADVQDMLTGLLNDEVILLCEDANCPDGPMIQFGCDCLPARLDTNAYTSGTTATDGKKGYLLTFTTTRRFFYEGTITKAT